MLPNPLQIRAARTLLGWKAEELAQRAGVSRKRIERMEDLEERTKVSGSLIETVVKIFEEAGVVFVPSDGKLGRGVRFKQPDPPSRAVQRS
jgi:predicted transcriptional regulator